MYEQLALYIDGEFVAGEGRRTQDVINPATLEVLGQLPHATEADLDRALAAAQRAFESWKKSSPMERSAILRKVATLSRERAKEIGRNMTLDQGKPLADGSETVIDERLQALFGQLEQAGLPAGSERAQRVFA